MAQPLPVIIEDLVAKVRDSKTQPEQRQHYAGTLKNIIDESTKAYKQWEQDWVNRR